jgi:hypothetical protein
LYIAVESGIIINVRGITPKVITKEIHKMKQQMILNNKVIFEGTEKECFREMIKRNLSLVQNTKTKLFVSEEIFANFGNFYTDI